RPFRRSPVFGTVAVLSLAFGIGANTAIFTLVDQVLLRLLPVKDPQQLVLLWGRGPHYGSNNGRYKLSYPMYEDFRDHKQVFSGMFCRWGTRSRSLVWLKPGLTEPSRIFAPDPRTRDDENRDGPGWRGL